MADRTLDLREVVTRSATADETDEFNQTAPYELRDFISIKDTEQVDESTTTAGTFTAALDVGGSPEATLAVQLTGPATLTVERSTVDTFGGEEFTRTVSYDAAGTYLEVLPVAHRYLRAKVNQNLAALALVRRGI